MLLSVSGEQHFDHIKTLLHGTGLHGQTIPVHLFESLVAAIPSLKWSTGLQGFMGRCHISPSPSPGQKDTTATVTAQHYLKSCHLLANWENSHCNKESLPFFQTHTVTHLYLLANILCLCNKTEAEAFGFPWPKVHTFLTWRPHTPLVVLLHMHTHTQVK